MNLVTKIACRTIGTAGIGLALYDAVQVGSQFSKNGAEHEQAKYLSDAFYNSRTIDDVSYYSKDIAAKTFDLRSKNPLPALWGRIKGGANGSLYALGNNLCMVGCSAFAILSKGIMAKLGAAGVTLCLLYNVARNGFGLGKKGPMS